MLREEYVVEIIRKMCENNQVKWRLNPDTGVCTAEMDIGKGALQVSIFEGWRGLIVIQLQGGIFNHPITEPQLMIRPNSLADKIRNFIYKTLSKKRRPDKLEKMSIDMQFVLEYAKDSVKFQESGRDVLLQKPT